jgi:hypothetical protein
MKALGILRWWDILLIACIVYTLYAALETAWRVIP